MRTVEEFSFLLQNCGAKKDLRACLRLYTQSVEWGLNSHCLLGGYFIRAFESCHSLFEASKHFLRLPICNVFTWSAIISAHVSNGLFEHAIQLYKLMVCLEAKPDSHTFVATLKACAQSSCLRHGMLIHFHIVGSYMELDCHISNTLIDFYGKSCCMCDARKVFDTSKVTDVVAWNAIIAGYAKQKNHKEALQLFQLMELKGIGPDNITVTNILKAFSDPLSLYSGKLVHSWIIERDFDVDAFVWSILIDVYAKCECIKDAQKLFESFSTNDAVTWGTMLAGYVVHGMWDEALFLFKKMHCLCIRPDHVTFVNVLKVVSETSAFEDGRLVHAYVVERAYDRDAFVVNSLVGLYVKCSSLLDARAVFENSRKDDPVAWGAIFAGYFQHGLIEDAFQLIDTMQKNCPTLDVGVWSVIVAGCADNKLYCLAFSCFKRMEEEGVVPDRAIYSALVKACWQSLSSDCARVVHSLIVEEGFDNDQFVGNALVNIYSKFGKLEEAEIVFSLLPNPDVVSWNALIEGYAQQQLGEEAILRFRRMQQKGYKPDNLTVLSVLKACAIITDLQEGMSIHAIAIGLNCELEVHVGSSLIDMYARCGFLDEACKIFERFKDYRPAWNAIINGFARNGIYRGDFYVSMTSRGIAPDHTTYLCLLFACSHLGLVHEGCNHYETMTAHWNLKPRAEHYGCMVDLWGRLGCLKEAYQMLVTVPIEKSYVPWMSLMHHSQVHGRFDLARLCLDELRRMVGCQNESAYDLMATFFGDARLQDNFDGVREVSLHEKWRVPGKAFIEVDCKVHTFLVGDKSHEASEDIYRRLKMLVLALRCHGFVPYASMFMQRLPGHDVISGCNRWIRTSAPGK